MNWTALIIVGLLTYYLGYRRGRLSTAPRGLLRELDAGPSREEVHGEPSGA